MFITNPNNQLSSFEQVIEAFKKYENGGFWVKKIIQQLGVFQESVTGPYKKEDADKLAERWRKVFRFEGKEVAKVLSYKELVCTKETLPIDEKYLWRPPRGAGLFCLIHNYYPVHMFNKHTYRQKVFRKFAAYVESEGIRHLEAQNGEWHVYYNSRNVDSYRRGHLLKRFLDENPYNYTDHDWDWIIDRIKGIKRPLPDHPILIPGYVERISWECYPIHLDYFKEIFTPDKNTLHLNKVWKKLKKCTPPGNQDIFFLDDVMYQAIEVDLLLSQKEEEDVKKLLLEKNSENEKYNLILTNFEDDFSIGIYNIGKDGRGEMRVRIPNLEVDERDIEYISLKLRNKLFITNLDIIGSVVLFIGRCLGIKSVYLDDDREENCRCAADDILLTINPIKHLAGEGSIYSNLGFRIEDKERLDREIAYYASRVIVISSGREKPEDDSESSISSSSRSDGEEEEYITVRELSKMYLDNDCEYTNLCLVLENILDQINNSIPKRYVLDLEKMDLGYYKNFF